VQLVVDGVVPFAGKAKTDGGDGMHVAEYLFLDLEGQLEPGEDALKLVSLE